MLHCEHQPAEALSANSISHGGRMFTKIMFRCLMLLATLIVIAGCGTTPATKAPVAVEATQQPSQPTPTMLPPTEQPMQASATASLPTPTPVITEIVATSKEQFVGTWKWYIQGTPTFLTFKPDGTWEIRRADAAPGSLPAHGEYSFDGNVFTVTGDPDCPGVVGKYEAPQIIQYDGVNHSLSFKVREDTCEARVKDFKKGFAWSETQP
jgi:hypothetical protein